MSFQILKPVIPNIKTCRSRSEVDLSDAELPDKDVKILEILARKWVFQNCQIKRRKWVSQIGYIQSDINIKLRSSEVDIVDSFE